MPLYLYQVRLVIFVSNVVIVLVFELGFVVVVGPLQVELIKLSLGSFTFFPLHFDKILFSQLLLSFLQELLNAQLLLHIQLSLLCELQGLHAVDLLAGHLLAEELFVVDVLGEYEFWLL